MRADNRLPGTPTKTKKRRAYSATGSSKEMWLLLLPALIPVVVLSVYPLVQGILLGFTDAAAGYNRPVNFNGIDNYTELLGNDLFWQSFRVGLIWAFSVTILQFLASMGLALLLNMNLRFRGVARVLALVPWAIPPVIIAIIWRLMLNPTAGPVNSTLAALGLPSDINWLGDPTFALPAAIVVGIWAGMPQTTVTLLAGLQNVPSDLHEAAALDGAGAFRRFRSVTIPSLLPIIFAITTLDFVWNFNQFALVYVLTAGGPGGQTMLPMLFAYNEAFKYGNFGYASAMGNVMVLIIAALLVFYLRRQAKERQS
ncbi:MULTISPECIES: carbohydrate ABC transporter permease [Microbacterium]|uniref:carbohydrate ABC transporter permease n=1 Tax=Microbacterium TaxID=33882 RepID=UPI0027D772CA|nr:MULTISPECIES: sugar ABC transporter permease [Microbacterium]